MWTISDIEKLAASGKIRSYKAIAPKSKESAENKPALPRRMGLQQVAISYITQTLASHGIPYELEYKFHPSRKFRFDIAAPSIMLACEYEGMVGKGQVGGHQTKAGYAANCTKYNLAAIGGWRVLRYTARNYKDFENDLKQLYGTKLKN